MIDYDDLQISDMNDPWVKAICALDITAKEFAELIIQRFSFPEIHGPKVSLLHDSYSDPETAADIIINLYNSSRIEWDMINSAMDIVMEKVVSLKVPGYVSFMNNCFYLIEYLGLCSCAPKIFNWLMYNAGFFTGEEKVKALYLNAVSSYIYIQDHEPGCAEMWRAMWDGQDSYWWNVAFAGLSRDNPELATTELPKMIARKCSDPQGTLSFLYGQHKANPKKAKNFDVFIKKAFDDNAVWVGEVVNRLGSKMKFAEKKILLERLKSC